MIVLIAPEYMLFNFNNLTDFKVTVWGGVLELQEGLLPGPQITFF